MHNVHMYTIYRKSLGISVPTLHLEEEEGQRDRKAGSSGGQHSLEEEEERSKV